MNKKTAASLSRIILASLVMLLSIAAISSAATVTCTWSNGGLDGDWNNPANWTGGFPDAIDGDLQMYTTTSCTCGLGSTPTPPGIRIIKVYSDHIEQEVRTLDSLP